MIPLLNSYPDRNVKESALKEWLRDTYNICPKRMLNLLALMNAFLRQKRRRCSKILRSQNGTRNETNRGKNLVLQGRDPSDFITRRTKTFFELFGVFFHVLRHGKILQRFTKTLNLEVLSFFLYSFHFLFHSGFSKF